VLETLRDALASALRAAQDQYGPLVALLILAVIILEWRVHRLQQQRLKDKDEEIKRVVAERDKLQDIILKNRQSTDKPGKGGKHG
jgi:hypothetical protein